MTDKQALKLKAGRKIRVKETDTTADIISIQSNNDGTVSIETNYKNNTIFYPDEIEKYVDPTVKGFIATIFVYLVFFGLIMSMDYWP